MRKGGIQMNEELNGWIAPNGEFFPCDRFHHFVYAKNIGKTEIELEDKGYIKVYDGEYYIKVYSELTPWQYDKLEQLGIEVEI
jgi:hypothetical protein